MSENYKKTCKCLNHVEQLLILALIVTDCVSISAFSSLVSAPIGITISTVGIKICAIKLESKGIHQWKRKGRKNMIKQCS